MCDFATQQLIEKTTLEKAQAGDSFTAYDVTKTVRQSVGRGTPVPHQDVKQEVHGMYERGELGTDYTRTLCNLTTLPAGQSQPWVYHQKGADLNAYGLGAHQPAATQGSVIVVPQATASAPPPGSDDSEDEDHDDGNGKQANGSYKVDGRSTLCIPANLIRALGLREGDQAHTFANPLDNTVVLTKDSNPQGLGPVQPLVDYTVNLHENVRITQPTLQRAGIAGTYYNIAGDADKVVVKLFSQN
jgi:hypothetical protein